ncbi:hypothetical protein N7468_009227 [Penicillium chermesinum]|uniref:Uncharacterized protein n=1 Tax=Penicillium chermesinum TaxID=63820 RepID=A0A9W9TET3_9EURO|nr:uncharacterized protein N7468_009227 [Penicillium chermesinum]KAJ5220023.1 hypothetical protein N7468_009227 [Penicillium chermesinum]
MSHTLELTAMTGESISGLPPFCLRPHDLGNKYPAYGMKPRQFQNLGIPGSGFACVNDQGQSLRGCRLIGRLAGLLQESKQTCSMQRNARRSNYETVALVFGPIDAPPNKLL